MPGTYLKLSYLFGGSSEGATVTSSTGVSSSVDTQNEVSGLKFEWGFNRWSWKGVDFDLGMRLDWLSYKISNLPADGNGDREIDSELISIPLLLDIGKSIHPLVRVSARIGYDPAYNLIHLLGVKEAPANTIPLGLKLSFTPHWIPGLLVSALYEMVEVNLNSQATDRTQLNLSAQYVMSF